MSSEQANLVYTLQLSKINCTNCEAKIKKHLTEEVTSGLAKVSVNILQEKVNLVLTNQKALQDCTKVLDRIGYQLVGDPIQVKSGNSSTRIVTFKYEITAASQEIQKIVRALPGIITVQKVHLRDQIKLTISYDSNMIKGSEIDDVLRQRQPNYITINHTVLALQGNKGAVKETENIKKTAILCAFFVLFDMVLPILFKQFFMQLLKFPSQLGPLTFTTLINLFLTLYVLYTYAKPFIIRSYKNYTQNGSMDMETLISLGCLSAFFLFCFFFGKFTIEFINGEPITGHNIMQMNDALASSSIIVLVVNIGKHFEKKVKDKIQEMSERLFPESKLFQNMKTTLIKLKNRKLTVAEKKQVDITLLEKNDIFEIKQGRLLADAIVISGEFEAIKSAVDGNDQTLTLKKGDRIQSGSIVLRCEENSLLQIENVFEKSVLIEIGTHIKLRENEEENSQSSIQAVCKTISKYFVKTVIMLSIVDMAVWFFLLSFNYVSVPGCNICWVIQRGIGVLVASCPCALGLAVPSVIANVLNIAIKNGILIRNTGVIQKIKKCKIISFDKTGTLFTRINKIQEYHVFNNSLPEKTLWEIIAVTQKQLRHPIAEILYKEAYQKCEVQGTNFGVILNKPSEISKEGLNAQILLKKEQKTFKVLLGNRNILINNKIEVPEFEKTGKGATVLYLALNQVPYMVIVINTHSNLRPEAARVIQLLLGQKKQVHILSGDSRESVEKLGQELKIPHQFLHPEHSAFMKQQWIRTTQRNLESDDGIGVIMVGDGLNDIPCLQQASIGVSINAKSQLNINASDVIMLSENLYKIVTFVNLLKKGNQFIKLNLLWAFLYNLAMMPIVAGVFYSFDVTVSPVWSSIAMSCSSIIVVAFSHTLSWFNFDESIQHDVKTKNQNRSNTLAMANSSLQIEDSGSVSKVRTLQKQKYDKFQDQV